jgi:hypothetical protein
MEVDVDTTGVKRFLYKRHLKRAEIELAAKELR